MFEKKVGNCEFGLKNGPSIINHALLFNGDNFKNRHPLVIMRIFTAAERVWHNLGYNLNL